MSMPPPTGNREFRNETISITSLTVNTNILEGLTFQNCKLIGPAILVPMGKTTFAHCNLGPGVDAIFWEIPPDRHHVVGAIGLKDCTLSACTLVEIGLGGNLEFRQALEQALG